MKSLSSFVPTNSIKSEKEYITTLEQRILYLEEVNRFAIEALDTASSLADFQPNINRLHDTAAMLRDAGFRIQRLIPFHTQAFFLVCEESDFQLAYCEPEHMASFVREEVDRLIKLGTFGWTLKKNRPVIVSSSDHKEQLILHVISTSSKTSGMFIGVIDHSKAEIPDVSLALLTIILLNTANILGVMTSIR